MASFFKGLRDRVDSAAEMIESHSPAARAKLADIGRDLTAHAETARKVLEEKTVEARDIARRVAADERTVGVVNKLSSGLTSARERVSSALVSTTLAREAQSTATDNQDGDVRDKISSAIEKLKVRDKVGVSAEVIGAAGGAAAGVAIAGTVAGAVGATTLFGSTGLASVLGGVLVTSTPVGWVLGTAALAGAAGYGLTKLVRSGAHQDRVRAELLTRLSERLQALGTRGPERASLVELPHLVSVAMTANLITPEQGQRMTALVERGLLSPELAVERLRAMALASQADVPPSHA